MCRERVLFTAKRESPILLFPTHVRERSDLLQHVGDPDERLTSLEYDRFIWLVELVRRARSQDAVTYKTHPFLVKDVSASAILVAANEALPEIARPAGPAGEQAEITKRLDPPRPAQPRKLLGRVPLPVPGP